MNFFFIALILILYYLPVNKVYADSEPIELTISEISSALQKGDSYKISRYFDITIELRIRGSEDTYSKQQAEMIVRDFFSKNKPVIFEFKEKGFSKTDIYFAI